MKKDKPGAEVNTLCQRCANACKQPVHVKLIKCPHFEAAPQQLEIPLFRKTRSKSQVS
jgi:hypothetical protein